MTETVIPLGNKPFVTPYTSVGREVCKNLYLEYSGSTTAKAEYYAIRIPGMSVFSQWKAGSSRCRGMYTGTNGRLYYVNSSVFAWIDGNGFGHQLGTLNTAGSGRVYMTDNGSELLLLDGVDGWIFKFGDESFTRITDASFPGVASGIGPTHAVTLDGYFLVNDPGTTQYWWSWPYYTEQDGEHWDGLNFNKKSVYPEPIIALASCNGQVWLFGSRSCEVHYNTGNYNDQNGVWQKYDGAVINMGCSAKDSVCTFGSNVFWMGADLTGSVGVWSNDGFTPRRISTRGIEQIIQLLGDVTGSVGFIYTHNGHTFYVLQLPSKCLVYDVTTDAWHERTYLNPTSGNESAWRGLLSASAYGKVMVGQIDGGGVCWIDQDAHRNRDPLTFAYDKIRWEKTSPITFANGHLITYHYVQPMFQQGVGLVDNLADGTGKDPVCRISWSNDSGTSYGNEHQVRMGAMGQYGTRSRKLICGMGRNRVWRISGSDPVLTILIGLLVDAEVLDK